MNFNSFNVVVSLKKGGLYVVFDMLLQIWSKRQYIQHMPPAQTYWLADWLTGWLPDQINKWSFIMNDWMNKCLFNALLICHRGILLRSPDFNVPTKDHIWWSSYYYLWKACVGMQLISNEEKMLRWQTHGVFAAVLRITANYSFRSSNFFIMYMWE